MLFERDYSNGPAVLLLGGCPTPADHLSSLAAALSKTHRVLLPDLPGYGRSPALDGAYDFNRVSDLLEQAVRARDCGPVDIVGYSLGAYRALLLALRRRVSIRRVVALSGFCNLTKSEREGYRELAGGFRRGVVTGDMLPERMLSPAFLDSHPAAVSDIRRWTDASTPEVLAEELIAASASADLSGPLHSLDVAVLARVGQLDLAVPVFHSEEIVRAVPNGTLQVVQNTGHALFWEDAQATTAAIAEFLR